MNPFDDPSLGDRTVIVNGNTKITKLLPKDPKVFQAEMDTFIKNVKQGKALTSGVTPPEAFIHVPGAVTDIIVGDVLGVTATENINSVKEFTAGEVKIQVKPTIK